MVLDIRIILKISDRIFVAQGAEYQAVCQGIKQIKSVSVPQVVPIPIGINALESYLQARDWQQKAPANILIMGLCGSLSPQYQVGDIVLYQDSVFSLSSSLQQQKNNQEVARDYTKDKRGIFEPQLTNYIYNCLQDKITKVTGLTSDRLIWSAEEKLALGKQYQASVVDMEGLVLLKFLQKHNHRVAMLRVVSDSTHYDIPNLSRAIDSTGKLQNIPMAIAMIKQPVAAMRLVKDALKGLAILQQITTELFSKDAII
ncbi:MAG: phosphorylase [Xenococcaceae cyanobacterium MO_188.B29]|nr:phosphorylase [Xenococcaceae cyanobacterium MO_188.B29]